MQTPSRLEPTYPSIPPEIHDHILDCLAPPQSDEPIQNITYKPDENERLRISTVLACTLVCRNWLPRARIQLFYCVWVTTNEAGRKLSLTIRKNPAMADLIIQLVFAPTIWQSLDQPLGEKLTVISLLNDAPKIEHLVMVNVRMGPPIVPVIFLRTLGNRCTVTHLQLQSAILPSPANLISMIHSFKHLIRLSLVGMYFTTAQPADHPHLAQLYEVRPCWAAASLRTLEVGGLGGMSALRLLGDKIKEFGLIASIGSPWDPTLTVYRDCVREYSNLHYFRIVIEPWTDFKPSPEDEGGRVWGTIHDYILDLFRAVRSSALRTLKVSLRPQQLDPETVQDLAGPECDDTELQGVEPWNSPRQYRHTRQGMIDALFASDVREALLSPPFAALTTLEISVQENSSTHDKTWWTPRITQRLQGIKPNVIDVVVNYHSCHEDATYRKLWKEEGTASTTSTNEAPIDQAIELPASGIESLEG